MSSTIKNGMTSVTTQTNKIYAGIGSRSTPADICELMTQLGRKLALKGAVLRSGGAEGADKAFEFGCEYGGGKAQIFLAKFWYSFGKDFPNDNYVYDKKTWEQATLIASQLHPAWQYLKPYARTLHTRNCFQMLGISLLEPANFVLCWTPDGARTAAQTSQKTGGTGQAIRVADSYGIKVYNLAVTEDLELARNWLNK